MANFYQDVTLLITHFNRPSSLERLLEGFLKLEMNFAEIIVSDDGSKQVNFSKLITLQKKYNFNLVASEKNRGLGNNINKGQDKVKTNYTLYIQEDFVATEKFIQVLYDSVQLFEDDKKLDLIRYFSILTYPYLKNLKEDFLEMFIPAIALRYLKIYMYSDTPQLRRTTFLKKFGRYFENIGGDRMEYWMCVSFIQNKGKCLIHKDYKTLFEHENLNTEPSTIPRAKWKQKNTLMLNLTKSIYRQLKYNYDLKIRCILLLHILENSTKDFFLSFNL